MMRSPRQKEFAKLKNALLPQQCKECRFRFACHGECPWPIGWVWLLGCVPWRPNVGMQA
ncbi:MAG: SPASM domain-containing protein [Eikenella corrodens]|uniref:SPASM domain-containing protein n=1 Tax=Eikenella corrodens TaxID=539 RepID=UPI0036182411